MDDITQDDLPEYDGLGDRDEFVDDSVDDRFDERYGAEFFRDEYDDQDEYENLGDEDQFEDDDEDSEEFVQNEIGVTETEAGIDVRDRLHANLSVQVYHVPGELMLIFSRTHSNPLHGPPNEHFSIADGDQGWDELVLKMYQALVAAGEIDSGLTDAYEMSGAIIDWIMFVDG